MNTELLILVILITLGGFTLSGGALFAAFKKNGDAAVGYGFLTFGIFAGTIIAVSIMLYNMGAFRGP